LHAFARRDPLADAPSLDRIHEIIDPDYVSRSREYAREMIAAFKEIGKTGPFWRRPKT